MDEVKPAARLPTVEHREPCKSRGSRTVLGAPGGEIPPGNSSNRAVAATAQLVPSVRKGAGGRLLSSAAALLADMLAIRKDWA